MSSLLLVLCVVRSTAIAALSATAPATQAQPAPPAALRPAVPVFATGGIACRQGAFQPGQRVVAVADDGRELPTQCEPLAVWPDGSVKWMLVTAMLPSEAEELSLRPTLATQPAIASPSTRPASSHPAAEPAEVVVRVQPAGGGYAVDTGPLHFRVGTDTAGFIGDARLARPAGEPLELLRPANNRLWQLDYYIADRPGRSATDAILPPGTLDESRLQIDKVELERGGPVRATLVLRGRYLHEKLGRSLPDRPDTPSRVDIRIHAFAGQSYLLLEHTFVYEGNPETDFLARCGLTLPLNLRADKGKRVTAAAGQHRVERWMYANPLFAIDPPERANPGNAFPYWRSGGVVHDSYDHYKTYKLAEPTGGALTQDEGARAAGWIDISDQQWGCAMGIVGMAENYPAALEASNEDATVTAWLYPPHVAPADLRRYTQLFGTGEAEPYPGKATGISKTHRLWVYFHAGRDDQALVEQVARQAPQRHLLKLDPQEVARAGVFGSYRWSDPQAFPRLEQLAGDVTDFMLAHQAHYRWFGIFDFGDFQSIFRVRDSRNATDNLRWMNDWGRWGWVNDEGLIAYWLLWQYVRTGRPEYFDAGVAMVAHVRDVDVKHTKAYPWGPAGGPFEYRDIRGFGHRHNVHHWGDGYIGPRVANPIAWRLYYYLTGDGRTRDCLDELYQANVVENKVWPGSDSMPTALYALYARYEMTGDVQYRKKIEAFVRAYCDYANQVGYLPDQTPWDFLADRPAGEFRGKSPDSFFWHSFGMSNFLVEWFDLTTDADLREALIRQARATLANDAWDSDYCHFQILSVGYRLTNDKVFLTRMADLLGRHVNGTPLVPADRSKWFGPETFVKPKTISMIGFLMSGLPYVEYAVGDEQALWPAQVPQTQPADTSDAPSTVTTPDAKVADPLRCVPAVGWMDRPAFVMHDNG